MGIRAPGKGQGRWGMTRASGHMCLPDHSPKLGVMKAGWDSALPETPEPFLLLFSFSLIATPSPCLRQRGPLQENPVA